jgi:hypothetical protein
MANEANIISNAYRLAANEIRPGESFQDAILLLKRVPDLELTTPPLTVVSTPFKPGTKVFATVLKQFVVNADGNIDFGDVEGDGTGTDWDDEVANAASTVVLIVGKAMNFQIATDFD